MSKTKQKAPDWWEMTQRLRDSGGLLIGVGLQGDGAVYSLDFTAKERLAAVPPNTPRPRSIFIGHHRDNEFEQVHAPHWPRIVEMLTGLSLDQLKPFAPIRIISPQQERVLWEWRPADVNSR